MNKKLIWISVSVIAVIALLIGLKKAGFEDPEKLSNLFLGRNLSFEAFYTYLNR